MRRFSVLAFALIVSFAPPRLALAAESATGLIFGRVTAANGAALAGVRVSAASTAGRYAATSDTGGRFTLLGVAPDTYTIAFALAGFAPQTSQGIVVLPGGRAQADAVLAKQLRTIGTVQARALGGTRLGDTQDQFLVVGEAARGNVAASSSGLGSYERDSVQGAVAAVPGVQQDQFANVIVQGGKVEDTVFSYDGVPVPQALIAEPGGNVIGAQLPTVGVGYTTVTTGGQSSASNQGLGAVIDEIPATGVYPAQGTFALEGGLVTGARSVELAERWATPDLRARYSIDAELSSEDITYGDGHTFYPAEAATYGLSLSSRATWSVAANVHLRAGARDDLSFVTLAGQAVYDQYGTPFAGETYGSFDANVGGVNYTFPGEPSPNAPYTAASRVRGTYGIEKLQDLRTFAHATLRVQAYGSEFGSQTVAPFFDDLSFPNGVISYDGGQNGTLYGFGFDVQDVASDRQEISYGSEIRTQHSVLDEFVPTLGDQITSEPTLNSYLTYLSDRWNVSPRTILTGTLRANGTHFLTSDGQAYGVSAIDPHLRPQRTRPLRPRAARHLRSHVRRAAAARSPA
jgi:hypothetical protein